MFGVVHYHPRYACSYRMAYNQWFVHVFCSLSQVEIKCLVVLRGIDEATPITCMYYFGLAIEYATVNLISVK